MNTIDISYDNANYKKLAPKKFILEYLNKVLEKLEVKDVEFSVTFVNEENMHNLNLEYRNIDDSTDILSFASEDETEFSFVSVGKKKRVIGDMLICPEVLERNANSFSVTVNEELRRLLIHGVLHLLGENHQSNDIAKEKMLQKQEKLLLDLGL